MDIVTIEAAVSLAAAAFSILQYASNRQKREINQTVKDAIDEKIEPLLTRMAVVESKVDVFWKDVSYGSAKSLHHPEPTRQRLDELLDAFMQGILTEESEEELRGYLQVIRDWHAGDQAPFMIYPGEQVAAAILLSTMGHVLDSARRSNGK